MEVGRARRRRRQRGVGHGWRGYARNNISDYIRSTLVDHVINHGLTMREAGQRVHPHLSRFTVASIIRTFRLENRYVFSSLRQTVSTVFTVLYHMTANHVSSCLVDFFNSNCTVYYSFKTHIIMVMRTMVYFLWPPSSAKLWILSKNFSL